jgi:hypothetical protein
MLRITMKTVCLSGMRGVLEGGRIGEASSEEEVMMCFEEVTLNAMLWEAFYGGRGCLFGIRRCANIALHLLANI